MRKETYANKLAALLGITPDVVEKSVHADPKKKNKNLNGPVGVSEDEIQNFRAAQGIVYFLQAPELFSNKVCPHCGESFLVSRQYVAFCSYTCIRKDLEAKGLSWSKGQDIERLVTDVYEGNEPIWIRNLEKLREILDPENSKESLLSQTSTPPTEPSIGQAPTSSAVLQTT